MSPSRSWPKRAGRGTPRMVDMRRSRRSSRKGADAGLTVGVRVWNRSALVDERALALVQGPERLFGRNGGEHLVEVPLALGLFGLLHLVEIHRVNGAAVDADGALAEERVVDRDFPHLGHDLLAILALQGFDGLQVVQDARIDARLGAGRHLAAELRGEALGEV